MVTRDNNHGTAALSKECREEIVILRHRALRWIGRVKYIACDEHCVDGMGRDGSEEEVEESPMLLFAGMFSERLPQVPVRRVQDAVGARRFTGNVRSHQFFACEFTSSMHVRPIRPNSNGRTIPSIHRFAPHLFQKISQVSHSFGSRLTGWVKANVSRRLSRLLGR